MATPPSAPGGVAATAGEGAVTVSWNAVEGADSYRVFWNTQGAVDAEDSSLSVAASPYLHSGLTAGTSYYYRVGAENTGGLGTLSSQVTATPTAGQVGYRLIACGDACSFLVDEYGRLYAWGGNEDGQLGIGSFNEASVPTLVGGITNVVAVSSGKGHTLALTGGGQLYAWGYNTDGALGIGHNQGAWVPTPVVGGHTFAAMAAGRWHSVAITTDGEIYAWGSNVGGILGLGYEGGYVTEPQAVTNTPYNLVGIMAAGWSCSFYKSSNDGSYSSSIYSWGSNSGGQLGRGDPLEFDAATTPFPISNTVTVFAMSARYHHALALREGNTVLSWGSNSDGQLGWGTEISQSGPDGVELVSQVVAIAAGDSHSLALGRDGRVMSWGGNGFGQLGDGTYNGTQTRTWVNNLDDIVMIASGGSHNLAVRSDGSVWAWGKNTDGQLGDGTSQSRLEPVRVTGF